MTHRYVVSASRRTDIAACQPGRLASILNGREHFARNLRPDRIHTLLISTKDFRPMLDHADLRLACAGCDQVFVNLTITGLGGSGLEPKVPKMEDLFGRLPELCDFLGSPSRLVWCFSPVLEYGRFSNLSVAMFERIAGEFSSIGGRRAMAMFFRDYGNSRIRPRQLADNEKRDFAARADDICAGLGLVLSFCHVPGFHRFKCVDLEWMASLHPEHDTSPVGHYRRVRGKHPVSHCRDAIWDVGWYTPPCPHGCEYCYARSAETECPAEAQSGVS